MASRSLKQARISEKISYLIRKEHKPRKQAIAMAINMNKQKE